MGRNIGHFPNCAVWPIPIRSDVALWLQREKMEPKIVYQFILPRLTGKEKNRCGAGGFVRSIYIVRRRFWEIKAAASFGFRRSVI